MTKSLVVFYSFDGNTKFIAHTIAKQVGADVLELKTKEDNVPKDFTKHFWGGKMVVMKEKPALVKFDKNPADYDVIFLGTPVWAFNYSPPFRTFFSKVEIRDKKVALFCCSGGMRGSTFENMKRSLGFNDYIGEIEFKDPLKDGENSQTKAKWWIRSMKLKKKF